MPARGNQISVLVVKNLQLSAVMFKMMEHFSRAYDIRCVGNTTVLKYLHQWELEQKKQGDIEAPKVDKNNS